MKKTLVWSVTLSASFALAAACGGGGNTDGMGGEGGEDGSTGGNDGVPSGGNSSSGGGNPGGAGGEGGLGGGGPIIIQPETCSDGEQNELETDVDCGGPACDPCEDDGACVGPTDCESGVCRDSLCAVPDCGDRVTNGTEECDPGGETEGCDEDCTFVVCGDGHVNAEAEDCEPDVNLGPWQRCGRTCVYGVDLDGTWRTSEVPGGIGPWEVLETGPNGDSLGGMMTFHYLEMPYLYDLTGNQRYDIEADEWSGLPNLLPYSPMYWENAAVDSTGLWVARESAMHRLDLETLEWAPPTTGIPDGGDGVEGSGAVYDGDGYIWYVGHDPTAAEGAGEDVLVKYDPGDGSYEGFSWLAAYPGYVAYEPRVAYDPVTDQIAFISYGYASTFLVFDLADETFTEGQPLPDGSVASDNACQDRAGGMYVTSQQSHMYRYDIGADTYEQVPDLPAPDDFGSTCVVSEVGYLYYGTSSAGGRFTRLRLNHR